MGQATRSCRGCHRSLPRAAGKCLHCGALQPADLQPVFAVVGGIAVFLAGIFVWMGKPIAFMLTEGSSRDYEVSSAHTPASESSRPGVYTGESLSADGALAKAELVFVGNYTQGEIKQRLDVAMGLYGVPRTEENYSRAASALVSLRQANGTSEMDILSYMIRSYVPGVNLSFPEAAGLASVLLTVGDR